MYTSLENNRIVSIITKYKNVNRKKRKINSSTFQIRKYYDRLNSISKSKSINVLLNHLLKKKKTIESIENGIRASWNFNEVIPFRSTLLNSLSLSARQYFHKYKRQLYACCVNVSLRHDRIVTSDALYNHGMKTHDNSNITAIIMPLPLREASTIALR